MSQIWKREPQGSSVGHQQGGQPCWGLETACNDTPGLMSSKPQDLWGPPGPLPWSWPSQPSQRHRRRGSSGQESPLLSCCRSNYPALGSSIAANSVIFETSCPLHTVKIGQLAQEQASGGWTNTPGFQPCFPKKGGLSLSAYSSKLYQCREMWFFRLKLWLFF